MRAAEILPPKEDMQTEADVADAQLQAIKRQQQALKVRKAQLKADKARRNLGKVRERSAMSE
jgi:hypothetical protein